MKQIVIVWVVCVMALVGLFVWLGTGVVSSPMLGSSGEALVRADFTLQSGNKTVTSAELRGRYLLVYFGFTHCPDICPTTLLLMNNVIGQLGEKGLKIQPVFISVDPERDTPEIAAKYAGHFGSRFLGLSGSAEQVQHAADSFKVYYSKVEDKGSALGYVVDHSGFIYLMGPDGQYITHFAHEVSEQELKLGLERYVH